ncbi:MAG: DUF5681 domain-containing protein [Terricaulis sp.]
MSKQPNDERDRADEAVGYCSPPKHSRFKPGQSGNPRGRKRRKVALNDIVEEIATMRVQVTVDGRVRTMPALEAILMLEVRKALQGDGKASRFVLETFESRGLGGAVKGSQDDFATHVAGARERLAKAVEKSLANLETVTPDSSLPPGQPGSK